MVLWSWYFRSYLRRHSFKKINLSNFYTDSATQKENAQKENVQSTTSTQNTPDLNFWNKRKHKERALERFGNCPIRVRLVCDRNVKIGELNSNAIDWFIATHLIYEFGTHNKGAVDVRRVHHERVICGDFNKKYDPFYEYHHEEFVLGGPKKRSKHEPPSCCSFPLITLSLCLCLFPPFVVLLM